jgi:hypothetical protein
MKDLILNEKKNLNAVLVGLITPDQSEEKVNEYLDELAFLAETAGIVPGKRFIQRLDMPNSVTFVGKGKLQEIKEYIANNEEKKVDIIIFDDELSPRQIRNIEKELNIRILDRTGLILGIFAMRAKTAHAKAQVELAQYQYLLPRLTRMWTHLERQYGGGGAIMRGPGETQLETDKRIVLDKISRLKKELKNIDMQKSVQRKNRGKLVRVALVGYTNVGKSIDTSMGMTPLEGLIMGTRSGDVDPGAITYIMDKEHLSSQGISRLLNKFSGVLGISGVSSDMREIEAAIEQGHERAILAMRMYDYRIKKYIGSYTAVLGGLDVLVFTGGVGENQTSTRSEVCKNMEYLGLEIDEELNASVRGKEALISTPRSKVKVAVIPTNEELTIAMDTIEIIGWKKQEED